MLLSYSKIRWEKNQYIIATAWVFTAIYFNLGPSCNTEWQKHINRCSVESKMNKLLAYEAIQLLPPLNTYGTESQST